MSKSFAKSKPTSSLQNKIEEKKKSSDIAETKNFKVSFEHFDETQKFGSGFKDWQKDGLLANMLSVFHGYSKQTMQAINDGKKFTVYGDWPPKERCMFKYPPNVPKDAHWARIHINNMSVVVGHVVKETFYVVFLDKYHKFYMTKNAAGIK